MAQTTHQSDTINDEGIREVTTDDESHESVLLHPQAQKNDASASITEGQ